MKSPPINLDPLFEKVINDKIGERLKKIQLTDSNLYCIQYNGEMLYIGGKSVWNKIGTAKSTFRRVVKWWIYDLFETDYKTSTHTFKATGKQYNTAEYYQLVEDIVKYIYGMVSFEPI